MDLDVSTQTIRRTLRKAGLKAAVRQKKPFLSKAHQRQQLEFALEQHWLTGAGWFGQMRPRLIGKGQMGGLGCGKSQDLS